MKRILLFTFSLMAFSMSAQTWADDVASIVYNKCTKCHNPNGIAPFSLVNYSDASPLASSILAAISIDAMPPWPPDTAYQSYVHDRSLSVSEKTIITDWVNNGALEGNPANTPPPPVFPAGAQYGPGDLELQIPTYMSKATAAGDDYVCFAMPSGLPTDRYIKAIEIVPGNRQIVHHALIYIDSTNSCVTDTVGGDCGGPSGSSAALVMGYTPGGSPLIFPSAAPLKLGIRMPANSQVVFAMHYPEGSYGEFDSTKVIFHFYPPGEPGIRQVGAAPILQNWSFALPPNQVTNVTAQYPPFGGLPANYSVMSVFPHMHLLGQSMKVYGVQPGGDTVKFINIPQWDFEWQDFYIFTKLQKIEAGGKMHSTGYFDNTSANPNNPSSPPVWVTAGLNTTDEMFLTYFHFLAYQPGDETYNLDSLMQLTQLGIAENAPTEQQVLIYPNPFNDQTTIYKDGLDAGARISLYIYDNTGSLIRKLMDNETINGTELSIDWDGNNDDGAAVSTGLYHLSMNVNGNYINQRIVKR